jgi:hypothetical protein
MATEADVEAARDAESSNYATQYLGQIRAADDEMALILIKQFGEMAFARGYRTAARRMLGIAQAMNK